MSEIKGLASWMLRLDDYENKNRFSLMGNLLGPHKHGRGYRRTTHIDDFPGKLVRFQTIVSIRKKYLLWKKIKFWHLGCFILTNVKKKIYLFYRGIS